MKNSQIVRLLSKIAFATCLLVIAAAIPLLVSASAPKSAPPASPTEAWSFMAFAAPYGRFKVVTTRNTTMADNGVFRYVLQGPNFDLFKVLNPENKSYIQTTVSQHAMQWTPSMKYPVLKKIGSGKLLNLQCLHYVGQSFRPGTTVDAWFTEDIPMEKGLTDSFSKLCGVPTGYGLPVKVQFKGRMYTENAFQLLKLGKTRVAIETLLVPKSYHLMQDQALFFFSDEDGKNSGIDELMRSKPLSPSARKSSPK